MAALLEDEVEEVRDAAADAFAELQEEVEPFVGLIAHRLGQSQDSRTHPSCFNSSFSG